MIVRLLTWDRQVSIRLRVAEKPGPLRTLAAIFAHSGDSWFWFLGLGLVWLLGPETWRAEAVLFIVSILLTAIVVMILKFTIRRRRPEGEWGSIYRKTDPHSFPSGHAARAFLLPVIAAATGPPWFFTLLLIWGPLIALARVAMGVHYVSDIIAGLFVGILMGLGILWSVDQLALL